MCGIVGLRRFDGAPVDEVLLRSMTAQLVHRGPDGDGLWTDGETGFGHRRLSIIDLAGSPQPMSSADGRYTVCFNGEILNYRELRARARYDFRTSGDTELLLATFAEHGPDGVARLEGQFAFAVHDARTRELWLVRDRLGILPLYTYADHRLLAFASEVKALLPALPGGPRVDLDSLDAYLAARAVPAPWTLFAGVHKLPPGHLLRVGPDGAGAPRRWWAPPPARAVRDCSPAQAVSELDEALTHAVGAALVADVPVGAYLSGGVDSSLIVALAQRQRGGDAIATFAAGFRGAGVDDELPVARRVSALLGTDHHEVAVDPASFAADWTRLTWHRDAPLSEPADVAVHQLAQCARREVKVVLSGEGSDELFAGYPKHSADRLAVVPAAVRAPVLTMLAPRLPGHSDRLRVAARALAARTEAERFTTWFAPFDTAQRRALVGPPAADRRRPPPGPAGGDRLRRMLLHDLGGWLPDNLLERGDRMSMAASLELRPPFLDHRVVELAFRLPSRLKVRGLTRKWLVKEVARRYLPAQLVDRRKVGFRVPLQSWFRGELRELSHDLLLSPSAFVADVMDRREVAALLARHAHGGVDESIRIWTLLGLEVWHDVFWRTPAPAAAQVSTVLRTDPSNRS